MYNVSDAYKTAIKAAYRQTKVEGTVTLNDGSNIPISDSTILQGSLNIDNACVNNSDFELGAVYLGQLKCSLKTEENRYNFYGGVIDLSFYLKVNTAWEEVKLGVFTINEATRKGKYVSITAYDNMVNLEGPIEASTIGTPFEILTFVSDKTGIELEQTQEEIDAMTPLDKNGELIIFKIPDENNYDGYRDLLSDISMVFGGFCTISRTGKIKFIRFGSFEDQIDDRQIKNKTISDYEVFYSNVKCQIGDTIYESGDGSGNTLYIDNEFINVGTNEIKQCIMDNIANQLQNTCYTPVEIKTNGDPAIDLGDFISYTNIEKVNTVNSLVMKNNWTYKSGQTITSVGANPKLASSKSKVEKQLGNVQGTVNNSGMKILPFQSTKEYDVGDSKVKLLETEILVGSDCSAMFNGQIVINVTNPGTFKIIYEQDSNIYPFTPMQIANVNGDYIINLYSVISGLKANLQSLFTVYIVSEDGGSGKISKNQIWTSVLSTSLLEKKAAPFDGNVFETVPEISIGGFVVEPMTGTYQNMTMVPIGHNITTVVPQMSIGAISLIDLTDSVVHELVQ